MEQAKQFDEQSVSVGGGKLKIKVKVRGDGPPLLYLHPSGGLVWDEFLERLSRNHTVYAPHFPGTDPDDPHAIRQVDDLWDAVLIYEELVRALGLLRPAVVGQSFGGMLAAELASCFPDMFSRVVLLDPVGLWRDDHPVADWISAPMSELPALLFKNPQAPVAQAMLALPEDKELQVKAMASLVWSLGCTGKFCWPIPDRGLHKRLHRMSAPALIVWGEEDALVPSVYAEEFRRRIVPSRVVLVPDCGHIPQVEQLEPTYAAVSQFLAELS